MTLNELKGAVERRVINCLQVCSYDKAKKQLLLKVSHSNNERSIISVIVDDVVDPGNLPNRGRYAIYGISYYHRIDHVEVHISTDLTADPCRFTVHTETISSTKH